MIRPVAEQKEEKHASPLPQTYKNWRVLGGRAILTLAATVVSAAIGYNIAAERIAQKSEGQTNVAGRLAPTDSYTEEGSFPRLQERVLTQLGFVNSLLVTLAVGLLAFAAIASADSSELHHLGWRKWFLVSGIILLAVSALAGIFLAQNRLRSHRMTARTARLRQLRDRLVEQRRPYELIRLAKQADFLSGWGKFSLTKKYERHEVRNAARSLSDVIPDEYKKSEKQRTSDNKSSGQIVGDPLEIAKAATSLVEALRSWYEKADDWTWRWLTIQGLAFVLGAAPMVVVPLSYLYR